MAVSFEVDGISFLAIACAQQVFTSKDIEFTDLAPG
jgi:hypothetical protein